MNSLESDFGVPQFSSVPYLSRRRAERLIGAAATATIIVSILGALVAGVPAIGLSPLIVLAHLALSFASYRINETAGAAILALGSWLLIWVLAWQSGELATPNVGGFAWSVALMGLCYGSRGAATSGAFVALASTAFWILQSAGLLPYSPVISGVHLAQLTGVLIVLAALIHVLLVRLENVTTLARQQQERIDQAERRASNARGTDAVAAATHQRLRDLEHMAQLAEQSADRFNNLLTVMQGHVSAAMRECDPDSPIAGDLYALTRAVDAGIATTTTLTTLAKHSRDSTTPIAQRHEDAQALLKGVNPMAEEVTAETILGLLSEQSPTDANPRVLVVEDQGQVMRAIVRMLRSRSLNVHTANTAGKAIEVAAEVAPHVLLVDVTLPDGRGDEVAEELEELYPDMNVILMSGMPMDGLAKPHWLKLDKPFNVKQLEQIIAVALGSE